MRTKEELIKELQQYSTELNGRTPSEKVFYDYAGIKLYDLHKYGWANWRELVIEAGLTPNKFDKTKYTTDELCQLFVKLIRIKKRWPTRGELDVKHHQDSTYPESGTFYDKLGKVKSGDLPNKIIDYLGNKKGYNDVLIICKAKLGEVKTDNTENRYNTHGWVYLLKTKLRNAIAYKIGRTNNLKLRIRQLNQPSNEQELVWTIETDDPKGIEHYWHQRFQSKRLYPERINDEWFQLDSTDIKAFKKWRKIV